jgi:hypothetical protein
MDRNHKSAPPSPGLPTCTCFNFFGATEPTRVPSLHQEEQDVSCEPWKRVVERVERAILSQQEDFAPLEGLNAAERACVITLPVSIERLVNVRRLNLLGSCLVRLPPEISGMRSLASLDLYVSHRLHFLPYEIVRCGALRKSKVSTRALYGNFKYRAPFPDLQREHASKVLSSSCSVCGTPLDPERTMLRWITLKVATDAFPLLVSSCSMACIAALPTPAAGYVQEAHVGGEHLVQPLPDR